MLRQKFGVAAWSSICGLLEHRERSYFEPNASLECPFGPDLRVALVKQSTYCDLYSVPGTHPVELLKSSIHRTGPIGLFLNFEARFIIVHPEPDPECRVWEEKLAYEIPGSERSTRFPRIRAEQAAVAVSAREVDWSEFDLVIAFENAVPARITRRYPEVLWCTLLEHHRLAPYSSYLKQQPEGYDAFLQLRYGPNPQSIIRRPHVVDYPYGMNFFGGLRQLYPECSQEPRRVMLEDHQEFAQLAALLDQRDLSWYQGGEPSGSLNAYHGRLASSRIFFSPGSSRPLGGLAVIDAASLGCLIVGRRADMWNPFIVLPELDVSDPKKAVRLTAELVEDSERFEALLAKQSARLNWFAWHRPLQQISNLLSGVHRHLSIKSVAATGLSKFDRL